MTDKYKNKASNLFKLLSYYPRDNELEEIEAALVQVANETIEECAQIAENSRRRFPMATIECQEISKTIREKKL